MHLLKKKNGVQIQLLATFVWFRIELINAVFLRTVCYKIAQ